MANTCADCDPKTDLKGPADHVVAATAPAPAPAAADPLLDPSTFTPPPRLQPPGLIIEFCDRAPRATWVQTELFLTFPPPALNSICLQPLNAPETGGRFRVWLDAGHGDLVLVWDRKVEGGFPELKVLKQRLRDLIQPNQDLGHSDKKKEA